MKDLDYIPKFCEFLFKIHPEGGHVGWRFFFVYYRWTGAFQEKSESLKGE